MILKTRHDFKISTSSSFKTGSREGEEPKINLTVERTEHFLVCSDQWRPEVLKLNNSPPPKDAGDDASYKREPAELFPVINRFS